MIDELELLGCGVVLSWLALTSLFRLARPRAGDAPEATYRRLFAVLLLSSACLGLPWLRASLPHFDSPLGSLQVSVQLSAAASDSVPLAPMKAVALSPFALLGLLWLSATSFAITRLAVARLRLRALLGRATVAPIEQRQLLESLTKCICAPRARLLLSAETSVPFSVGYLRPVVVLPMELFLQLSTARVELVLRHELAHLRRRDPLAHGVARVCAAAFTWHPSVSHLLHELVIAREAAVDAEVAANDRYQYASLLLEIAARVRFGQDPEHVSMDATALSRRIDMLTKPFPHPQSPSLVGLLLAAATITAVSLLAPRILADSGPAFAAMNEPVNRKLPPGHDPLAAYQGDIDECYELARAEDEELVIATLARFEVDPKTYRVSSALVPTPESPIFQSCLEQRAMSWSFPPPPDMPPPPRDMPRGAKLMVAVHIDRQP